MNFNLAKIEEKILKFWEKNKIFQKSISQRKKRPSFVFSDGPPFATGKPHYGHILATTIKDTVLRYFTMRGYQTPRRVGWDCHGLPIENLIEKELGIKNKKEIENLGIEKFNQACRASVFRCVKDFEKTLKRVGRWADYQNAYATLSSNYIESVWWVLKQLWNQGLVYKDYRICPYCPRCSTPLSNFEVNLNYKEIKETSIYLKFKIKDPSFKNSYFLAWTTTPWTLPGNFALAVNPKAVYLLVKEKEENYIIIKERRIILKKKFQIIKEFKGKDLIGLKYEPLFDFWTDKKIEKIENAFQVLPGEFVSSEEGTGIVHIAPMYGDDDFQLGKKFNLPFHHTVDSLGFFTPEVEKFAGQSVKNANLEIIKDLSKRNLLYKTEEIVHSYPFCWRCEAPLIYYAFESWYIAVTKIKKQLVDNNKKIHWVPIHIKEGRFGKWLIEARDWNFSRTRFWGAPLPIWQCPVCQQIKVIASLKDLLSQKFSTNQYFILRHGQTIYQREKKSEIYPYPEKKPIGLTKRGIKEIQKAAQKLKKEKIDLIYSSNFFRTKETAKIIAKELGLKINFDSRLRDINLGIFHSQLMKEYLKKFPITEERFKKRLPQGESWAESQKRMIKFLKEIDKKNQNKKILIISHGDSLWLLEGAMKGKTIKELIEEKKEGKIIETGETRKLEFKILPKNKKGEIDFHRPYIDEIKFFCHQCNNLMKKTPEVFDCWFESGSVPYAQWHYPFENKILVEKTFPADFIAEGLDQTRGWFYTLHVIATALTLKNIGLGKAQPAFKNVIVNGLILDAQGRKLSKRLGNYPEPKEIFDQYGADSLRYFLLNSTPIGEDYRFSAKGVEGVWRKIISTIWHSYVFFKTYKRKDFKPKEKLRAKILLDKWILSRFNQLNKGIVYWMDQYEITKAIRLFDEFIDDFSNWYIRRSRRRFQKPENKEDNASYQVFYYILKTLSKLTAPFLPFISEEIYQNLKLKKDPESVHLCDFPLPKEKLIDKKLEEKIKKIREIISLALAERARVRIKIRQPLSSLKIKDKKLKENKELLNLIKDEINIKEIIFDKKIKKEIELNTKITPALKEEGMIREIIRQIQDLRKKIGLIPQDKSKIYYFSGSPQLVAILIQNKEIILKETNSQIFEPYSSWKDFKENFKKIKFENQELFIGISK